MVQPWKLEQAQEQATQNTENEEPDWGKAASSKSYAANKSLWHARGKNDRWDFIQYSDKVRLHSKDAINLSRGIGKGRTLVLRSCMYLYVFLYSHVMIPNLWQDGYSPSRHLTNSNFGYTNESEKPEFGANKHSYFLEQTSALLTDK